MEPCGTPKRTTVDRGSSVVANELSSTFEIRSDPVEGRSAHAEAEKKSLHMQYLMIDSVKLCAQIKETQQRNLAIVGCCISI